MVFYFPKKASLRESSEMCNFSPVHRASFKFLCVRQFLSFLQHSHTQKRKKEGGGDSSPKQWLQTSLQPLKTVHTKYRHGQTSISPQFGPKSEKNRHWSLSKFHLSQSTIAIVMKYVKIYQSHIQYTGTLKILRGIIMWKIADIFNWS